MKLPSIQGIPLEYIQSILKIDSTSSTNTSGLIWLPRENLRWNTRFANKSAGYIHTHAKDGYRRWMINITYNGKPYFVTCSRVIFLLHNGYLTEGKQVDHEDVNSLNNSIDNIRETTPDQNQRNRKIQKNNTSGHKGVYWNKRVGKWVVRIYKDNKSYSFGYFDNKEDAIKVAIAARKKLHGEFGRDE
jgi:hypothetical protein